MSPTNRRSTTAEAGNGLWRRSHTRFPGRAVVDHGTSQVPEVRVRHGRWSTPSPSTRCPTTTAPPGTSTVTAANAEPGTNRPGRISNLSPASRRKARSTTRPRSSTTITRPSTGPAAMLATWTDRSRIPSRAAVGPMQNQRSEDSPASDMAVRATAGGASPTPSGASTPSVSAPTSSATSRTRAGARWAFTADPDVRYAPSWPAAGPPRPG